MSVFGSGREVGRALTFFIAEFFARWGWPLVFVAVAVVVARPFVEDALRRRRYKATQHPERVAVLSEDLRRVRQQQQRDYLKVNCKLSAPMHAMMKK